MIGRIYKDKNDNYVKVVAKAMLVYTNLDMAISTKTKNYWRKQNETKKISILRKSKAYQTSNAKTYQLGKYRY